MVAYNKWAERQGREHTETGLRARGHWPAPFYLQARNDVSHKKDLLQEPGTTDLHQAEGQGQLKQNLSEAGPGLNPSETSPYLGEN